MYGYFSPLPLLPGVMHQLSQLCGDIEDGGTKHASVLHPWSQVSGTGERNVSIKWYGFRNSIEKATETCKSLCRKVASFPGSPC